MNERVELVRSAYDTAERVGYLDTDWGWFFDRIATDDCELRVSRTYPDLKEVYRGREGWIEFWEMFAQVWKTWTQEMDDIYEARDAMVVALMRVVAKGHESGITSDRQEAHIWSFRGDRVCGVEAWPDRAEAFRELGLTL